MYSLANRGHRTAATPASDELAHGVVDVAVLPGDGAAYILLELVERYAEPDKPMMNSRQGS
eukprot:4274144-Alexandrium_andersonii.AAC.1